MRKALLMVVALSSTLWSVGLAETWMGNHAHQMDLLLISGGLFLYGAAFVLFCCRSFQWRRRLHAQGIHLSGLVIFGQTKEARASQREMWLQAAALLLIPLISIPLSFFQSNMDATLVLSIYLVLPLSLLFYAILSKDFDPIEMTAPS